MSEIRPGIYEIQSEAGPVEIVKVSRVAKPYRRASTQVVYYRRMETADVPGGLRVVCEKPHRLTEAGFVRRIERADAIRSGEEN